MLRSSINGLMTHYFQRPTHVPCAVVACTATAAAAANAIQARGVVASSPPEVLFALLFAIARDLTKGGDELLKQWRDVLLACPIDFCAATTDEERRKVAVQYREDLADNFAWMRYNAAQKMIDVKRTIDEIAKSGNPTVEAVSACCATVRWSSAGGDVISKEFVDCAMTVLKMMIHPVCERVVLNLAEAGVANPLDNIYKLHKIVVRCGGSADSMTRPLGLMCDFWQSGALAGDQFAVRHLGAAGKSLTDLMLYMKNIRDYLFEHIR